MDATLSAYNPTWRDRLAQWMLGNGRPTAGQRDFVSGLLGSAGTGSTGASVADFTPAGGLLGAQEAAQAGDAKGMAMAMLPMPAKAAGRLAKSALPMDEASRLARAAEQGYSGPWYHGANRSDRLVEKGYIDPRRATSGPMPFFTDNPEIASNYAKGKVDTSLAAIDDGDLANYFTVNPKDLGIGGRTPVSVERSWAFLPQETRQRILENWGRVGFENQDEFTGPLKLHDAFAGLSSPDHYDYILRREARGNPLAAMRNIWLEGGQFVDDPGRLEEVMRLAGYPYPISQANAPWTEASGVMPAMLRMTNPLDTSNVQALSENVIPSLERAFAKDRSRKSAFGADMWDKNHRFTPREWVEQLRADVASGANSSTFTSIPDKVTAQLRELGYDGILDVGGKMGGEGHLVAIPFSPEQVRSRFAAFDPKKLGSRNIMAGLTLPMFGLLGAGEFGQRQPSNAPDL